MPWQKIEHQFANAKLSYNSEPNFQPCIKVSVFFKKIDSIDYDTFFGHWRTVHADLAIATQAFKNHIVRYAQVYVLQPRYMAIPGAFYKKCMQNPILNVRLTGI